VCADIERPEFSPKSGFRSKSQTFEILYFEFAGKVFAIDLINSDTLQILSYLSIPFLRQLIGEEVTFDDLADIDAAPYSGMRSRLDHPAPSMLTELFFVAIIAEIGVHRELELNLGDATIATAFADGRASSVRQHS
jgi:hypothetical protein